MNKNRFTLTILLLCFFMGIGLSQPELLKEKPDKLQEGLKIYVQNRPFQDYSVLGTVKRKLLWYDNNPSFILQQMVTMTKKKYPKADGLIFYKPDYKKAQVIRFSNKKKEEEYKQRTGDPSVVTSMPNLVAFWMFGEPTGVNRQSKGGQQLHPLYEVGGPIPRVEGGPFSGYAAQLNGKQYFKIPHNQTGDLNICGPNAQVSMFAVVKLKDLNQSRTIAGIWSEGKGKDDDTGTRQYAMLMNMPSYGGARQLTPHISSEGGVTTRADGSKFPWCVDYAATQQEVPEDEWCTLAFTYDGKYIKAYINGVFEARTLDPEADKRTDPYFTKEGPDGKDRGMNPYYHGKGIFCYNPTEHLETKPSGGADFTIGARYAVGSMFKEATIGLFGGLAVFNRALTDEEIKKLHNAANLKALQ